MQTLIKSLDVYLPIFLFQMAQILMSLNGSAICENPDSLEWMEIPEGVNVTRFDIVDAVCSVVDFEALMNEVITGMEGLEEFIISVSLIPSVCIKQDIT